MASSPYRRDDWYGTDDGDSERTDSSESTGRGPAPAHSRADAKAAVLARELLEGLAPALCGQTVADPDRAPVELTAPEAYPHGGVPTDRPVRVNEQDGLLAGGESTYTVYDGMPADAFCSLVEFWLDYCRRQGRLGPDLRDTLAQDAQSMKATGDLPDEAILQRIVRDALGGERGVGPGQDSPSR